VPGKLSRHALFLLAVRCVLCAAVVGMTSCADPPRPPIDAHPIGVIHASSSSSSLLPASSSSSSLPASTSGTDADASSTVDGATTAAPRAKSKLVLSVRYVNLAVGASTFEVDDQGHAFYEHDRRPENGIDGALSPPSMEKLRLAFSRTRFCAVKPPEEEPMTFTIIRVDLSNATSTTKCEIKMAPEIWKKRAGDVMRTIQALQEELCRGPCKDPYFEAPF
jgi:hypothetical protein